MNVELEMLRSPSRKVPDGGWRHDAESELTAREAVLWSSSDSRLTQYWRAVKNGAGKLEAYWKLVETDFGKVLPFQ